MACCKENSLIIFHDNNGDVDGFLIIILISNRISKSFCYFASKSLNSLSINLTNQHETSTYFTTLGMYCVGSCESKITTHVQ